jgi:hypothetical protein
MIMKNPTIEELEGHFLPKLETMAAQLRRDFPSFRINTWSWSIGSATTDNPAHNLGIDCLFPYAPAQEADNVALVIGVSQVKCNPYLSDLAVSWGAGSSHDCIGADLLESPMPWSKDAISRIEAALPTLFEVLIAALRSR